MGYFSYLMWMLPALIISLIAQGLVNSAYNKNSKIQNMRGMTGAEAARQVLLANNVSGVNIVPVQGKLTDHFDPRNNTIYLSEGVYNATTIAAVGIAAHEAGHAVQHAEGYLPNKIRGALVPVTNFGSRIGWILILIGFAMSGFYAYYGTVNTESLTYQLGGIILVLGIILYSSSLVFTLVTLPVEFNASNRALKVIRDSQLLTGDQYRGAKQTLTAAALTYVAAAVTALLQLLRVIAIAKRRR
ncbi:MAG: zinc metallopeptidase [Ruminococcaceae bacterium]|nr:zinc metallopeptidase [Oscillospiraceae bacterium]